MKAILEVHASSLDSYSDCALRGFASLMKEHMRSAGYEIRDTQRYITPEVGTAIHAGIAHIHGVPTPRIQLDALPAKEVAKEELLRILDADPNIRFTEKMPDLAYIEEHMGKWIDAYIEQVLGDRPAKLIEYGMEGELSDGITYKTTLDLYTESDILADLKTGQNKMPAYNQVGFYLILLERAGYSPNRIILDYILPDKKDGGRYKHSPVEYDVNDCREIVKRTLSGLIDDFLKYRETESIAHVKINPRSAACNPYLCPLYGTTTCNGWKKL